MKRNHQRRRRLPRGPPLPDMPTEMWRQRRDSKGPTPDRCGEGLGESGLSPRIWGLLNGHCETAAGWPGFSGSPAP